MPKFKPGQYYTWIDHLNIMHIYKIESIAAYERLDVKGICPKRGTRSIWDMETCSQDRLLTEAEVLLYV